jgi:hypothetical protein
VGIIEGLSRLGKTKSAPDGNAREMGLADRGTRGPASSGADLDGSRQARPVNRWETIVRHGHRVSIPSPLGVSDVCLDSFHQLGRHVPNAMFLRMLGRFREDLLFRLAAHHVLTPARWIDLGAFQDFGHGCISPVIGVAMSHHETGVVEETLC